LYLKKEHPFDKPLNQSQQIKDILQMLLKTPKQLRVNIDLNKKDLGNLVNIASILKALNNLKNKDKHEQIQLNGKVTVVPL
jgi:hypothetical protein